MLNIRDGKKKTCFFIHLKKQESGGTGGTACVIKDCIITYMQGGQINIYLPITHTLFPKISHSKLGCLFKAKSLISMLKWGYGDAGIAARGWQLAGCKQDGQSRQALLPIQQQL